MESSAAQYQENKNMRGGVALLNNQLKNDETARSTQRGGTCYRRPERGSTAWHLEGVDEDGNNASQPSTTILP